MALKTRKISCETAIEVPRAMNPESMAIFAADALVAHEMLAGMVDAREQLRATATCPITPKGEQDVAYKAIDLINSIIVNTTC